MDQHDDSERTRDLDTTAAIGETHASTGGAAVAGAVTGGVIGLAGGPIGAVVGAVGGAIVGAAAERMMHSDDESERDQVDASTATGSDLAASDVTAASSTASLTDERTFADPDPNNDDTER